MYIKEANLDNFGKFHHKSISFSPGINVIYGGNESGKSTLHRFLFGMLFGMEKQRGRGAKDGDYPRYEPWNSASYYAGSLSFAVADKDFTIERNFYHMEKSVRLYNQKDQEELSVEHGDLDMLLGNVGKNFYENTYCISQAAVITQEEFARGLQQEMVNAAEGGEFWIDVRQGQKRLAEKKKQEEQKQRILLQEKKERLERLTWQQEIITRDIEQIEQKMVAASFQQDGGELHVENAEVDTDSALESRKRKAWLVPAVGGVLVLWHILWKYLLKLPESTWTTVDICLWIGWILWISARVYGLCQKAAQQQEQVIETKVTRESSWNLLKEQLEEKQMHLANLNEELEEAAGTSAKEREVQLELESIALAEKALMETIQESYRDRRGQLEKTILEIYNGITGKSYKNLEITQEGQVFLHYEDKKLTPGQLSRGALEQLHFALRLGVGRCMIQEEPMPILLDEPFCAYDEQRLQNTLKWLSTQQEQIIFFTCQRRELEIWKDLGVTYHTLTL